MAVKSDKSESLVAQIGKELTCAVCLEHYTEPKVLSCLHYYCKKCIVNMARKRNPFGCPQCRKETKITIGKEDELPAAHLINRLEDIHANSKKAVRKEIQCGLCSNSKNKAEAFCKQCGVYICKTCMLPHSRIKVEKEHQVVSLKEMGSMSLVELASATTSIPKCSTRSEPLKFYCFDCKMMICRDCAMIDHSDHNKQSSRDAAKEHKAKLKEKLKPLRVINTKVSTAIKEINDTKRKVESQGQEASYDIEYSFQKLHDLLKERKIQLLGEVKEMVDDKIANLSTQRQELDMFRAQTQSVLDYTQHCIQCSSDGDLMREYNNITAKIKKEKNHFEADFKYMELEEADILCEVMSDDELVELCDSVANASTGKTKYSCSSDELVELYDSVANASTHITKYSFGSDELGKL